MNREQRRKYDRDIKKSGKKWSVCPECKHPAAFYTHARGEKDTVLICERCGEIIREGEELTKLIPPGLYLSIPLNVLDNVLLAEAEKIDEEEVNEKVADTPVEAEGSVT